MKSMSDLTGRVAVGYQPGIWVGRASAEGLREVKPANSLGAAPAVPA